MYRHFLFGTALLLSLHALSQKAGALDSALEAQANSIAPFIDNQTIVVASVNLAEVQADRWIETILKLVPEADEDIVTRLDGVKQVQKSVVQSGVNTVFLVVSLADIPRPGPFIIIPNADDVDGESLGASLKQLDVQGIVQQRIGDAVFVGPPSTLERIKNLSPDARPELKAALTAVNNNTIQILLLPPHYAERVVTELMPALPRELGGGPSTVLTNGIRWAALGITGPPNVSVRLIVKSKDANAAQALGKFWRQLSGQLAEQVDSAEHLRDYKKSLELLAPTVQEDQLILELSEVEGTMQALFAAITPPLDAARTKAKRSQTMNDLKQIMLAMHNFHDTRKSLPAVGNTDASGKLLLSWRVHLLPYVEQMDLYKQFHLDEPWDSDHNRTLIAKMPEVYRCPASRLKANSGLSTYRVISDEGTAFPGKDGIGFRDVKDGLSNTLFVVEVDDDHAVTWTKPEGLSYDPQNPAKGLGGHFDGGFLAGYGDGSVRFITHAIDPETLRRLITCADMKPVPEH
jgi:hypothetical protein